MSVSTSPPPPAPPSRKRGLGCVGFGCLGLVVVFLGLVAAIGYILYTAGLKVTTATPAAITSFDGGDTEYQSIKQKLADFAHDLKDHQAATVRLSGDEINTLLARDPNLVEHHTHLYVVLVKDQAFLQGSVSTNVNPLTRALYSGRYFDFKSSFTVAFDPQGRSINFIFHTLQLENQTLIGGDSGEASGSFRSGFMGGFAQSFGPSFNQALNNEIRKTPGGSSLLDQAKSVRIENGALVIETQ